MTSTPLMLEKSQGIAVVVLNRPEARNAINPHMACMLADAFVHCANDENVRVVVVTATGDKAFCSGGDLGSMLPLLSGNRPPADEWDQRLLNDRALQEAAGLRNMPFYKPVIAAINGSCLAAGMELMLATDIRLAADHATFGLPEARHGLIPFGGSMARLPRQVPYCLAMELMLTGRTLDAREALTAGLINAVVAPSELQDRAMAMARQIAANAPVAVQRIKETVLRTSGLPLKDSYLLEDESRVAVFATEDAREGPQAFMQKRPPVFRGK